MNQIKYQKLLGEREIVPEVARRDIHEALSEKICRPQCTKQGALRVALAGPKEPRSTDLTQL